MFSLEVLLMFALQVAVILIACRVLGVAARAIGQPEVVGQMIAGIMLGPSLLGHFFPGVHDWLFPQASRPMISLVAQVGVALYMFLIGAEFEIGILRHKAKAAASISLAGLIAPFALGALLAATLYTRQDLFPTVVGRTAAMIFLGTAISITAFPVMASILSERGLSQSDIGTMLLAAGSFTDAIAWCILAVLLGVLGEGWSTAATALGGTALFGAAAYLLLRPFLRWTSRIDSDRASAPDRLTSFRSLVLVLATLAACAWYTEQIGIHAVFGAFVLGLAVPRGWFALSIRRTLMPTVSALLIPVFFASSGLNTRITLLDSWALLGTAGLIFAGACAGKLLACAIAAKLCGETTRDSLAIGSMMNARGLMELIVLGVGLERGIITPTLFSIGALMAVVTTVMAMPMFDAFRGGETTRVGRRTSSSSS